MGWSEVRDFIRRQRRRLERGGERGKMGLGIVVRSVS